MSSNICGIESAERNSADFFNTDVTIIGAGVAGLYASYCCNLAGIDSILVESLMFPGGQCSTIYPEKKVYGTPGFKDIKAKDFINHLSEQILDYDSKKFFGYKVETIKKENETFDIYTKSQCNCRNTNIKSKYIILATGIGDMKPSIPSTITGLDELSTDSDFVQHYCMKMDLYKGKNVIIAGGGDSAIDFAINIAPISNNTTIIHRRNKFTCEQSKLKDIERLTNSGKLTLILEHNIVYLKEKNKERLVITKDKESKEHSFSTDYIVFCYGFLPNCQNSIFGLENIGLQKENNLIKVDINTMETTVKGCYAAGDIVSYINKKKNIVPCFFEADRVVRSIKKELYKE